MFFEQAHKWIKPNTCFSNIFHNLEVYLKLFVTVGLRKSFFCDSRLWLCLCCLKLRHLLRCHSRMKGKSRTIYKGKIPYVFQLRN